MTALIRERARIGSPMIVPGPVLAQVWRGGARQALLARFLNLAVVQVDLLSRQAWLTAGRLCGQAGASDVVDAAVVVCAREQGARIVVTSDAGDLRRLDPDLVYRSP